MASGSSKPNGKAKVWWEVSCPIHGTKEASDHTGTPRLRVGEPKHGKKQRTGGCPVCKKLKAANK